MLDFIHPNYPPENWHIIYPENWCLEFFKMKFPFKILFRGHVKFQGGRAYERVKQSNSGILTLFICSMTSTHAVCSDMGSQSYLFKVRSVHLCGSDMFTLVPRNIYTSETQKDFQSVLLQYIFACYSKWFVKVPSNKKHGYSAACSIKSLMSILTSQTKK